MLLSDITRGLQEEIYLMDIFIEVFVGVGMKCISEWFVIRNQEGLTTFQQVVAKMFNSQVDSQWLKPDGECRWGGLEVHHFCRATPSVS